MTDDTADTALRTAIRALDAAAITAALKRGADPNLIVDDSPVLLHVALGPYPEQIDALLSHGADPNLQGMSGLTPLAMIAWLGKTPEHLPVARRLIAAGADVNATDDAGTTVIERAAQFGNRPIFELLQAAGATVSMRARQALRDYETRGQADRPKG